MSVIIIIALDIIIAIKDLKYGFWDDTESKDMIQLYDLSLGFLVLSAD